MARQVEVKVLCDPCMARDQEAAGEEFTISLQGDKPLVVAFCEPHRKEFYDPIVDALAIYGEKASADMLSGKAKRQTYPSVRAERGSGEHACPVEGCTKAYAWRGSLRTHVQDEHGTTLAVLEGRTGSETVYKCEVEGCGRAFDSAQGLALHTTRLHRDTT